VIRILNWHFNGNDDAQAFIAERDYQPGSVRIYAVNAPSNGDCKIDIRDDGTTIFADYAKLPAGDNTELDAEDYSGEQVISQGSVITCHVIETNGAGVISVQLELESADEEDEISE